MTLGPDAAWEEGSEEGRRVNIMSSTSFKFSPSPLYLLLLLLPLFGLGTVQCVSTGHKHTAILGHCTWGAARHPLHTDSLTPNGATGMGGA